MKGCFGDLLQNDLGWGYGYRENKIGHELVTVLAEWRIYGNPLQDHLYHFISLKSSERIILMNDKLIETSQAMSLSWYLKRMLSQFQ